MKQRQQINNIFFRNDGMKINEQFPHSDQSETPLAAIVIITLSDSMRLNDG